MGYQSESPIVTDPTNNYKNKTKQVETSNKVFIATSLDGCIADRNGKIDWLHNIENPNHIDMGYKSFMDDIDAIIMGRNTFETVCSFGIEWPYDKPVFVLSNTLTSLPQTLSNLDIQIIKGQLNSIIESLHAKGILNLYIDGGKTIQSFLAEDLIDELIITTIPKILGGGVKLFTDQKETLNFKCVSTSIFLDSVVQNHFKRA